MEQKLPLQALEKQDSRPNASDRNSRGGRILPPGEDVAYSQNAMVNLAAGRPLSGNSLYITLLSSRRPHRGLYPSKDRLNSPPIHRGNNAGASPAILLSSVGEWACSQFEAHSRGFREIGFSRPRVGYTNDGSRHILAI